MSAADAKYRVRTRQNGDNAQRVASIGGQDGGFLMSPQHVMHRKMGHLPNTFVVEAGERRLATRLMDALGMGGFILDADLESRDFASWTTGPERWSQFFFDACVTGELSDERVDNFMQYLGAT